MLNPDGYGIETWEDGKRVEHDHVACSHCGRHTRLKPGEPPYATCKSCLGFICALCYERLRIEGCKPQEQMLLEMEGRINERLTWQRNLRER